jgi:RND family efflux transporter MFP subunit
MLKKIIPIVILVVLVAAGIRLVKKKQAAIKSLPRPESRLLAVAAAAPSHGEFAVETVRLGTLAAKQPARLAARISAHILELSVREGDRVEAGEILVRLDDRREKDRLATVKADLAAARTQLATDAATFARDRKLFAAKAISQEALDRSRARHDASRARVTSLQKALDTALTDLSYTLIKAPTAGIITARYADPGDLATPGKPLLGFEDTAAGYLVQVNLPQSELSRFRIGGPARILPDRRLNPAPDHGAAITAAISRLHPAVGPGSLAVLEIDLSERPFDLPTGSAVRVRLTTEQVSGWRLPGRAVLENVDQAYVFGIDEKNRIKAIEVAVKARYGDWYVVDGRLEAFPQFAIGQESMLLRLHDGMKIRVAK